MKKTLLASVILGLSAASSASAVTLYQENGSALDLYGRIGAYMDKTENTSTDLKDDESRIGVKASHVLSDGLSAIGGVEMRFSDSDRRFSDPTTHDAYVGLKHDVYGTFTMGRQATTADDLALSKYAYQHENITKQPTHGDRTLKYRSADFGGFSFGVDHTFMGSNDKSVDVKSRSTGAGLFYATQFGEYGFKANAGYTYTQLKDSSVDNTKDATGSWLAGAELTYRDFGVAVDYAQSRLRVKNYTTKVATDGDREDAVQVALKYKLNDLSTVFTSYQYQQVRDSDTRAKDKTHQYTIGADYKLHKNVVTYAQLDVTHSKASDGTKNNDVGGAVGLRLMF